MRILAALLSALLSPLTIAEEDITRALAAQATYWNVTLSPDGQKVAANVRVANGIGMVVMSTDTGEVLGWLAPGRFQASDIHWANNTRLVLQLGEKKSYREQLSGNGELYAMNYNVSDGEFIYGIRAGDGRAGRTSQKKADFAWGWVVNTLPDDEDHVLVLSEPFSRTGSEERTVVKVNVYNGKSRDVIRSPVQSANFLFDSNNEPRIAVGIDDNFEVLSFYRAPDSREWQRITQFSDYSFQPLSISSDGNQLKFIGRHNADLTGYHDINLDTGEVKTIYQRDDVDLTSAELSSAGEAVLALRVDNGYSSYVMTGRKHQEAGLFKAMLEAFPGMKVSLLDTSQDSRTAIVHVSSDTYPGLYYLYRNEKLSLLFDPFPRLAQHNLKPMEPIVFNARDGQSVHGYLTRASNNNGPTVVLVHGGPHFVRDYWSFDPEVQMLAAGGYHVLQVNFRGSSGYGETFQEAGYQRWGSDVQYDIIDAALWAINAGIADKDRICIMGGSFGAYAAVQSAILEPEFFCCSVAVAGIYDLALLYEKGDVQQSYAGDGFLKKVIGEKRNLPTSFSPVHNVEKLNTPVLVIHGVEDQRAPVTHARALMKALKKHKKPFQSHIEDKEGHGFFSDENRYEYFQLVKTFLKKHL